MEKLFYALVVCELCVCSNPISRWLLNPLVCVCVFVGFLLLLLVQLKLVHWLRTRLVMIDIVRNELVYKWIPTGRRLWLKQVSKFFTIYGNGCTNVSKHSHSEHERTSVDERAYTDGLGMPTIHIAKANCVDVFFFSFHFIHICVRRRTSLMECLR